jgi:hypothetical protein
MFSCLDTNSTWHMRLLKALLQQLFKHTFDAAIQRVPLCQRLRQKFESVGCGP